MANEVNRYTKLEDLPEFLSIKEAAQFLGISYATIRKHVASGKIPSKELGGRSLIPKAFFTTYEVRFEPVFRQLPKPELVMVTKRRDGSDVN